MSATAAKLLDRAAGGLLLRLLRPLRVLGDLVGEDRVLGRVREIAVVKFWGAGNAALILPVLETLKERYPGARLTVVTLARNRRLFSPVADRVLTVRMQPMALCLLDLLSAAGRLRRLHVDLALDFEQFLRSSQLLLFAAGARQVVAFDTAGQRRGELAHVLVRYDDTRHTGESFLDLARAAGVRRRAYVPGGLRVDSRAAAVVDRVLGGRAADRPLVVLHPGSGDNFAGRRWPTRRFGLLARRLVDEAGACVVLTGGDRERQLAREVAEAAERRLVDLAGKLDLDDLVALLARAAVVVSNDTGPVHLAGALGTPVVALFGPNSPQLYGPLSKGSVSFYAALPCSPCITNFNYKTSRCRNPVCIQAIEVDPVADAALRLVRRAAGARLA